MPDSSITKKALATALKRLMATRPLPKISIGDICEACSMNRKSFYYHFKDKYDLVNWIFYTEFVERLLDSSVQDSASFLTGICEYFYANRAFYVNALEQTGQNSFSDYFAEVMRPSSSPTTPTYSTTATPTTSTPPSTRTPSCAPSSAGCATAA